MAWMSSGRNNAEVGRELIDRMVSNGLITNPRVAEAMKKCDRANYLPPGSEHVAYEDSPQRISFNATISAPHMHAHACSNLADHLEEADRTGGSILDVGSGSGYLTAVFHRLAPHATVIGIDHLPGLTDTSRSNLARDGVQLGDKIDIVTGDGRQGWPACAPYKVIHVGAAAPTIPEPLIEQLDAPGRMFIPVGDAEQDIWQVDKDADGNISRKKLLRYVPLTDHKKQWPH